MMTPSPTETFDAWPTTSGWPAKGDRVRARYLASAPASKRRLLSKRRRAGAGRWFAGTVLVRHPDGMCDVLYDCGEREECVVPASIVGGAPTPASATRTADEPRCEALDDQCLVASENDDDDDDDDDLRSLPTQMTDAPADRFCTEPFESDEPAGARTEQCSSLRYLADVCALAIAAIEPSPQAHAPEPKKLAQDTRAACLGGGCARRPFMQHLSTFLGLCGECRRTKDGHARTKCVAPGCEQMRRHESGRCRLCEGRAARNPHLPMCIESGCGRRFLPRGKEAQPERCAACARVAAARK
jgi:hypothetical protein